MKSLALAAASLSCLSFSPDAIAHQPKEATDQNVAATQVTLIELFTSQGCSSCPPADDLFASLALKDESQHGKLVLLSWHVDYWDYLGWKDPFATARASDRQREYAASFKRRRAENGGVYTPQIVVNGLTAFVGSDKRSMNQTLAKIKSETPANADSTATVKLEFTMEEREPGAQIVITLHAAANLDLHAVVVESGLQTKVKKGENAGRTLNHANVVRAHATERSTGELVKLTLALPEGVDESKAQVIVFAQEPDLGRVLSANSMPLTKPEAEPSQPGVPATPKDQDRAKPR